MIIDMFIQELGGEWLDKYSAIDLVNAGVHAIGGKHGGGRRELAMGGGNKADIMDIANSLADIVRLVQKDYIETTPD